MTEGIHPIHPPAEPRTTPMFSVLIATFNQSGFILETLEAVAGQICSDYELVIVNDGSTDDTEERVSSWIRRFSRNHPNRVVLSTTPNGGQSAAFEHGFGLCSGRWIALLDSDDRWLPEKLQSVADVIATDPTSGMIVHPLYVIDASGRRTGDIRPKRARLSEGDLREQMRATARHVAPATSAVAIRADVFRELLPMPTKQFPSAADSYLTFGATLLAPVHVIWEPLAEYRMHPGGQYLQRMLSPDGLRRSVEIQLAIVRHFGLEDAARRSSFFSRNVFALAKLQGGISEVLASYRSLIRATVRDRSFSGTTRASLLAYWTICLLSPRPAFRRLWRAFQLSQTGYGKLAKAGVP